MDQIIILDGNTVGLVSDGGAAKWEFDNFEDAIELYRLFVMSLNIEDKIAIICDKSI
ncbi:hypothetical protein [Enterococcus plantarum]|uniref:hypothetical protein n=1 Tax=Enterococcus plantarum TaxID=1077675 RepID=UPI0015E885D1|nr:hypothetical protein [Enterococcus plantarum]